MLKDENQNINLFFLKKIMLNDKFEKENKHKKKYQLILTFQTCYLDH
jgi:hypothetical protein